MQTSTTWWQSVIIGASGGTAVWILGIVRNEYLLWRDKKIIYNWLNENTKNLAAGTFSQRTLKVIASATNIPIDRAREICYKHKKIYPTTQTEVEQFEIR